MFRMVLLLAGGFVSQQTSLRGARLSRLTADWRADGYRVLQALCCAIFEDAARERELPILNWWENLGSRA